jgi:maltooligosyltrehalose trehalohydrolase
MGLDALWNDDFHHSAHVALTGHNEAYFTDYRGAPQEFISAAKRGYLYQGQWYAWQKNKRGTPALDIEAEQFVSFLQNHDQVANSLHGLRIHQLTSPGRLRAATALMLLGPGTPMLFQGQEFAASAPFAFFADHKPELNQLVATGRRKSLSQFPSLASEGAVTYLRDPAAKETFEGCKLDWSERGRNSGIYALHKDLLRLRLEDPVFSNLGPGGVDGAILGVEAFVLRYFGGSRGDRLLLVNFGRALALSPVPEPLLAPLAKSAWRLIWSSDDPRYGGFGVPELHLDDRFRLEAQCAIVLAPIDSQTEE